MREHMRKAADSALCEPGPVSAKGPGKPTIGPTFPPLSWVCGRASALAFGPVACRSNQSPRPFAWLRFSASSEIPNSRGLAAHPKIPTVGESEKESPTKTWPSLYRDSDQLKVLAHQHRPRDLVGDAEPTEARCLNPHQRSETLSKILPKTFSSIAAIVALSFSTTALAAGAHEGGHGHPDAFEFGAPGEASEVNRTIEVTMVDNYFEPESLSIEPGETVRFVVKNEGEFLHEFNIGTAAMHAEHQEEMMVMMEHGMLTPMGVDHEMMKMDHSESGMAGHVHDDPNSVLVDPGASQEIIWKFAKATNLEFACNVPGHYDAGMMGEIEFVTKVKTASGS